MQRQKRKISRYTKSWIEVVSIRRYFSLFKSISWRGSLLLVLVFTLLVSTLYIPTADAKTLPGMTPTEQMKSWLYYNALSACINDQKLSSPANHDRISEENAINGNWFSNPRIGANNPSIGYFLTAAGVSSSGGGENVGCGGTNVAWIVDAATLWGYESPIHLLCDTGASRTNDSSCTDGSDGFEGVSTGFLGFHDKLSLETFQNNVKKKVYSGKEPSRSDAARYVHARNAFYVGCLGTGSPSPYTGTANDSFVYTVQVVDPLSGDKAPVKYYGTKKSTDTIGYSVSPERNNIRASCGDLAAQMGTYSAAYETYVDKLIAADQKGDESGVVQGCTDGNKCEDDSPSSCQIEAVGWILCPVLNFSAVIVDSAYGYVASLLEVQPFLTTGTTSGAYDAWKIMRNIANIAFVIVFLIVIFSQLTSVGISNYGVKKMLPRLVIAAILVNISYFLTAIAVDISNILGSSIKGVFDSINGQVTIPSIDPEENGTGLVGITGAIVAGSTVALVAYYVGLSALIPVLLAAVLAIITVFLVLTLRQALVILLVVIAPLAFVAYLLPNTEQLFTKWRKLLMTMLLMFPIIAALFGASALASTIVMQSAQGDYKLVIQIMGAGIAIIPLALTPIVMKSAGGVLNRFAGMVNNPSKGPVDRLRKAGQNFREDRKNLRNARALTGDKQFGRGMFVRQQARRNAVSNGRKAELNRASTEYVADSVEKNASFRNAIAGGTMVKGAGDDAAQRALASSISAKSKLEAEELSAASIVLKNARLDQKQMRVLATGGSVEANGVVLNGSSSTAVRAAAIQGAVASNDVAAINSLWNASKTWGTAAGSSPEEKRSGEKLREAFADSLQSSSARPAYIGQGAIAGLRTNDHTDIRSTVETAIKNNTYSAEKIAGADKEELSVVAEVLKTHHDMAEGTAGRIDDDTRQKIILNAEQALTDPRVNTRIGKNITQVQNIVGFNAPVARDRINIDGTLDITRTPPTPPNPPNPNP